MPIPERFSFDPRFTRQIARRVEAAGKRVPFFSAEHFAGLLAFPFQQPGWEGRFTRLSLLNALLFALFPPLAEMIEMGLAYAAMRSVFATGAPALPARLQPRAILRDGLRWWLVSVLFNLPSLLVFCAALALGIAFCDLPPLETLRQFPAWFAALVRQRPFWGGLVVGISVSFPLGLASSFAMYVAVAYAARVNSFRAALHLRAWGREILSRPGDFFRLWLALVGLGSSLFIAQQAISLPTAPLLIAPAIIAAFLSLYRRLVVAAAVAKMMV